jgi:hypothetical protein
MLVVVWRRFGTHIHVANGIFHSSSLVLWVNVPTRHGILQNQMIRLPLQVGLSIIPQLHMFPGRGYLVFLHAIDEHMAGDSQKTGSRGLVPVVAFQCLQNNFPLQLLE